MFLTPPIEVYPATNIRKRSVTTKYWQIFILSPPSLLPPIVMGGGAETMFNQITFIFSKNQHGTILSVHLTKFHKSEKLKKNKKPKFVNEIISTVPKV